LIKIQSVNCPNLYLCTNAQNWPIKRHGHKVLSVGRKSPAGAVEIPLVAIEAIGTQTRLSLRTFCTDQPIPRKCRINHHHHVTNSHGKLRLLKSNRKTQNRINQDDTKCPPNCRRKIEYSKFEIFFLKLNPINESTGLRNPTRNV